MLIKQTIFIQLVITLLLFTHSTAYPADQPDILDSSLRMLWGLIVVSLIILTLYIVLKKRFSLFNRQQNSLIKVLEIKHVMPRKSIMLIEVRGQEFLVGAGNDSINTITPISAKNSFDSVLEESEKKLQL